MLGLRPWAKVAEESAIVGAFFLWPSKEWPVPLQKEGIPFQWLDGTEPPIHLYPGGILKNAMKIGCLP